MECRRGQQPAFDGRIDQLRLLAGTIAIGIGQSILFGFRYGETGVGHAKRRKDMFLEIIAQTHAGQAFDRDPQHVGRNRVIPAAARFEFQRNLRQRGHIFVRREPGARHIQPGIAIRRVDAAAVLKPVCEARHMGEQINEAHRLAAAHGCERNRTAAAIIRAKLRKFGKDMRDRIVDRHLAPFDQLHEGDRGHRLGHAGDAKNRVVAHRCAVIPQCALMAVMHRLTVAGDDKLRVLKTPRFQIVLFQKRFDTL